MSWRSFRPYVPVAKRRQQGAVAARKLAGKGRSLSPVLLTGRTIASTFWGKAWCTNLEAYSDYENRLPRGRTYARNGSVIDLQITEGCVEALVQGSSLYKIQITFAPLDGVRWANFKNTCKGKIVNLLSLLQGRLSDEILSTATSMEQGLFPSPKEIKMKCSCPDWATMCKHVAATLYGVGARLDEKPEHFFTLRGVNMQELVAAAGSMAVAPEMGADSGQATIASGDLSDIFGVEIDSGSANDVGTADRDKQAKASDPKLKLPAKTRRKVSVLKPAVAGKNKMSAQPLPISNAGRGKQHLSKTRKKTGPPR